MNNKNNTTHTVNNNIEDSTILIVEDSKPFVLLLEMLLLEIGARHILSANNYDSAVQLLEQNTIDIFIVDIDLGKGRNGIMLAEEVRARGIQTPIIYITSNYSDEYFNYARHTRPSSFMNKELSHLKLRQAVDLALFQSPTAVENATDPSFRAPHITNKQLFFKVGDIFKAIPAEQIAYFHADQKMSYAKVEARSYPTNIQLKILEVEMLNLGFYRVHKSYVINSSYIESINPGEGTITVCGETLPIGDTYRKRFLSALKLLK